MSARGGAEKSGRTSGWYVLLLAWIIYAATYFLVFKKMVKDVPDVTNWQLLDIAHKYGPFIGAALGLAAFLATEIVYVFALLFRVKARRGMALLLTIPAYAVWAAFGYDLTYREPRYAEVAKAIITYTGKPMLYAAVAVMGLAALGLLLSLGAALFKKRAPSQ